MSRRAFVLLSCAALAACKTADRSSSVECSPPPQRAVDLLGWRALTSEGERSLACFDVRSLPYVRVRDASAGPASKWSLALVRTATMAGPARVELARVRSSTRSSELGALTFVRATQPPDAAAGDWLLELTERRPGCDARVVSVHRVRWGPEPEALPALETSQSLEARGAYAAMRAELEANIASFDGWARTWAARDLARAYQLEGDLERSAAAWKQAAEVALEAGVPTQASWALRSAAFQCWWLRCAIEAGVLLDRAEEIDRRVNNELGLARTFFYRGLLAQEIGDYRQARVMMENARRAARDLLRDDDEAKFTMPLADLLANEGRAAEGYALLSAVAPYYERVATRVDRSKYWSTLGWLLLRSAEASPKPEQIALARSTLEKARAMIAELRDPLREANVVANLAQLAYLAGKDGEARARLAEIPRLGRSAEPVLRHPNVLLLDALLLEREGKGGAAERAFVALEAASREETGGRDSDYTWRARYGVAQAKAAAGDVAGAARAYDAALEVLYAVGRRTVLQDSRATFFADRRRVIEGAVELALSRGDAAKAFAIADRALAEQAGALEAEARRTRLAREGAGGEWAKRLAAFLRDRSEWDRSRRKEHELAGAARRAFLAEREAKAKALRRSFDALYALAEETASPAAGDVRAHLAEGELLLAYTRTRVRSGAEAARWTSFAVTRSGVRSVEVDPAKPFAEWAAELGAARAIFVVDGGFGAARAIAAHVLPSGKRVIEGAEVALLPHAGLLARRSRPAKVSGPALVIADPAENLPHARAEGATAARLAGDAVLLAGAAATRDAVLAKLPDARLIHFAGHGILSPADPWAAHLQLAFDETLGLEDLLVLEPRARVVVLAGCQTGRAQSLGGDATIGLAEAFLLAGAGGVLAADLEIADAAAARFTERFYTEGGAEDPRGGFARAARRAIADGDDTWTAFRWFGAPATRF